MWMSMRLFWTRVRDLLAAGSAQRRTDRQRARFWQDVRDGEREAEDRAGQ